tara:strand:- start:4021 stop:4518 length:498 start_codon:yes stop_codon:yes gene_type:complete
MFHKKLDNNLYNTLLHLSRNIFFYKKTNLQDNFETRLYLMFFHFCVLMIIFKKKGKKLEQHHYDSFFHNIEYNLRELGFGDVSVNKKMKDFNKILYDILLKLDLSEKNNNAFKLNHNLVFKYFSKFNDQKDKEYAAFETYFMKFFNFCFELSLDNVLISAKKFKL